VVFRVVTRDIVAVKYQRFWGLCCLHFPNYELNKSLIRVVSPGLALVFGLVAGLHISIIIVTWGYKFVNSFRCLRQELSQYLLRDSGVEIATWRFWRTHFSYCKDNQNFCVVYGSVSSVILQKRNALWCTYSETTFSVSVTNFVFLISAQSCVHLRRISYYIPCFAHNGNSLWVLEVGVMNFRLSKVTLYRF
jgi:hypothetical protein